MKCRFEQTKESIIAIKFILQQKIFQASKTVSSSTNRKHFRALVHGHGHGLPAASLAEWVLLIREAVAGGPGMSLIGKAVATSIIQPM